MTDSRHSGNGLHAFYCSIYAKDILERMDKGDVKLSDDQWKDMGESLWKARVALEHAHERILCFAGPNTRNKKRKLTRWENYRRECGFNPDGSKARRVED